MNNAILAHTTANPRGLTAGVQTVVLPESLESVATISLP